MPSYPRLVRLRVRNREDTADLLVITSQRGGVNPYVADAGDGASPIRGEGQTLDLLTGKLTTGSYTIPLIDAAPYDWQEVWREDFGAYADTAALLAAWVESDPDNVGVWTKDATHVNTSTGGVPRLHVPGAVTAPAAPTTLTHVVTGLAPNTTYRYRYEIYGEGDTPVPSAWGTEWYTPQLVTSDATGAVPVTLKAELLFGTPTADFWYDNVRLEQLGPGTGRVVTKELWDALGVSQLLSHRAHVEVSSDNGATWPALVSGYVTALPARDALLWEPTIGDTDRLDAKAKVFETHDGGPGTPCILGGPIVGGFHPMPDFGATRWTVEAVSGAGADRVVVLSFQAGTLAPHWRKPYENILEDERLAINAMAKGYFVPVADRWGAGSDSRAWGHFPGLVARCVPVVDGVPDDADVRETWPIACPTTRKKEGIEQQPVYVGGRDHLVRGKEEHRENPFAPPEVTSGRLFLAWPDAGTTPWGAAVPPAPAVGDTLDVHVYPRLVSPRAPKYLVGKVAELYAQGWEYAGIGYTASAVAATTAALGADLYARLMLDGPKLLLDYQAMLGGPLGIAHRINMATGERVMLATRTRPAPVQTITDADLRDADARVFERDERTVVNGVRMTVRRFDAYNFPEDDGRDFAKVPMTGLRSETVTVEGERDPADPGAFGDRIVTYDFPGELARGSATAEALDWKAEDDGVVDRIGTYLRAAYGFGADEGELHCRPSVTAEAGDEIELAVSTLPSVLVGDDPAAQRIGQSARTIRARVTRRTPRLDGCDLRWQAVPAVAQTLPGGGDPLPDPGTIPVPAFTLAPDAAGDPTRTAVATVTNAATLAALGAAVQFEYGVGAAAPPAVSAEAILRDLTAPAEQRLTVATPRATVQVRARAVDPRFAGGLAGSPSGALSEWSAWQAVTLDPITDGGTPGGGNTGAPTKPDLTISFGGDGTPTATARVATGIALVKIALSDTGIPSDAAVRAAAAIPTPAAGDYSAEAAFQVDEGADAYAAAYAYDALGNESQKALAVRTFGAAGSAARDVVSIVTALLADGASEEGTIPLGKCAEMLKVVTSVAAWVRFYATAAARTLDATRAITSDPTAGTGVLLDLWTVPGRLAIDLTPVIEAQNADAPPIADIYYRVTNKSGAAATIGVDVTRVLLEE